MTRQELLFKRSELMSQVDAINRVLEMFPDEQAAKKQNASMGRYVNMTIAGAMIDYVSRAPTPPVVSEIAAALKKEGISSPSPNFTTMVSAIGNRLVQGKRLAVLHRKDGRKAFTLPSQNGKTE